MKIDFGDVFASGIGWLVKQLFLFGATLWFGCMLGGVAYLGGRLARGSQIHMEDLGHALIGSPILLLSAWVIPNAVFVTWLLYKLLANHESFGLPGWIILIAGESFFATAGAMGLLPRKWQPLLGLWGGWLVLTIMACTGLWFFFQWQRNRWLHALTALHAENSARREELKQKFGTTSMSGQDIGMP